MNTFVFKYRWAILILIGTIATATLIFAVKLAGNYNYQFIKECQKQGHHTYYNDKTWLCLTDDGRVVPIKV